MTSLSTELQFSVLINTLGLSQMPLISGAFAFVLKAELFVECILSLFRSLTLYSRRVYEDSHLP